MKDVIKLTKENLFKINYKDVLAMFVAESGAKFIHSFMFGVTLRENQRDYYYQELDKSFPGLKDKYID